MFFKLAISFALIVQCFGAGVPWVGEAKGDNWMKDHEGLVAQTKQHKNDIQLVFFGDSITYYWSHGLGKTVWNEYYAPRHAYNYGISGDRTENLVYRIEHGEFDGMNPKAIVLMIGTNNVFANTAADIAKGIKEIIHQLEVKLPATKILLLAVLPRKGDSYPKIKDINKIISGYEDKKKVFYLNMDSHFETTKDLEDLFKDGLHPNEKGYTLWHQVMEPSLKTVLGEN